MFDGIGDDSALVDNERYEMSNKGASKFMKMTFDIKTLTPHERK